jgi:hypothetical protein
MSMIGVCRGRVLEKGGNLSRSALGAEVGDEVADGALAHVEVLDDFRGGPAVDEKGSKDFVAAVKGLGGIEKELFAERVIHDWNSESVTDLFGKSGEMVRLNLGSMQGGSRSGGRKKLGKQVKSRGLAAAASDEVRSLAWRKMTEWRESG